MSHKSRDKATQTNIIAAHTTVLPPGVDCQHCLLGLKGTDVCKLPPDNLHMRVSSPNYQLSSFHLQAAGHWPVVQPGTGESHLSVEKEYVYNNYNATCEQHACPTTCEKARNETREKNNHSKSCTYICIYTRIRNSNTSYSVLHNCVLQLTQV